MILRIADESERAERAPWQTLAIICVCLALFLLPRALRTLTGDDTHVELEQAAAFWLEHPYLKPAPSVLEFAAQSADRADLELSLAAARRNSAGAPSDPETLEQEQSSLAHLTRLAQRGSDAKPGPAHPFRRFGLDARAPTLLGFVAHTVFHSGWVHLVLVLGLLALAGPALESRSSPAIFAALCLASALASGLAHLAASSGEPALWIGASGIAAGLVGAFSVRFGAGRVQLNALAWRGLRPSRVEIELGGWVLLPAVAVVQLALSILFLESEVRAGSAWQANLASLALGAALAFGVQRSRLEERFAARAVETRARAKLDPRLKRSITARERSQHDEAIALAGAVLRDRPDDVDALQAAWDAHVAAGRAGDGARWAKRLVELHARRGDLASGARIWDELLRVAHRSPVAPTTLLRIVPELVVQARRDAAIAALRGAIDSVEPKITVGQALRVAELGAELDPPTALRAAQLALASEELVDERRARLEQLVLSLENAGVRAKSAPASDPAPAALEPAGVLREDLSPPDETEASAAEPEPAREAGDRFELEPTQLGDAPPEPAAESATVFFAAPREPAPSSERIKVTPALPVALDLPGLRVRLEGGAPSLIEWTAIQAVGVGLVSGVGPNPLVVIDLCMNWADEPDGALEITRLRSDGFRARQLVTGAGTAQEALRALLAELLARSGAVPLPDASGAHGLPFREYASLDAYQSAVLLSAS